MSVNETSGEGAPGFTYTVAITRRSNQPTEDAETASYNESSESWTVSAATAEAIRGLIGQAAGGDEPRGIPRTNLTLPRASHRRRVGAQWLVRRRASPKAVVRRKAEPCDRRGGTRCRPEEPLHSRAGFAQLLRRPPRG